MGGRMVFGAKQIGLLVRLALIGVLLAGGVMAQAPARGTPYVIGVENIDYFPYFRGNGEIYTGFARDLFDAFAEKENIQVIYRPLPVLRLYAEFFAGEIDFKFPDNRLWNAKERKGYQVYYSASVVEYMDGVSVLPDRAGKGADSINKLAIVRGFDPYEWLDRISAEKIRLSYQRDFQALLHFVIAGNADGAYGNKAVVEYHLRESLRRPGALVFDTTLPFSAGHYHLSSLRHPAVIARFDAWMAANPGVIAQLKARFGVD